MTGSLRNKFNSNFIKITLLVTLFFMIVPIFLNIYQLFQSKIWVAKVANNEITLSEFQREYIPIMQFIKYIENQYGDKADKILELWGYSKNPVASVLDNIINKKILEIEAKKINIKTSKEYIYEKIQDREFVSEFLNQTLPSQLFVNDNLDLTYLKQYMERIGLSEEDFDKALDNELKRNVFSLILENSFYITEYEIYINFLKNIAKKSFDIITIPLESFIKEMKKEKLNDNEIKEYYDKNIELYKEDEKRSCILWQFSPENYGININNDEIENYYKENKDNYIEKPEKFKIKHILLDSNSKEKAENIAKKLKQDPTKFNEIAIKESISQDKDNEIIVSQGTNGYLFDKALFALSSENLISDAIKTTNGFEIIKFIEKIDPEYKPLEKVKDDIYKKLLNSKFKDIFKNDCTRIIKQSKEMPNILENFFLNKKAKSKDIGFISKNDKNLTDEIKNRLFNLKNIDDKDYYISSNNEGYIIILTGIEHSHPIEFEKVKEEVKNDLYIDKAKKAINIKLEYIKNIIKNDPNIDLSKVAKDINGIFIKTEFLNKNNKKYIKELENQNIDIEPALSIIEKNDNNIVIHDYKNIKNEIYYSLFKLNSIENENEKDKLDKEFKQNKDKIKIELSYKNNNKLNKYILEHIKSNLKIEYNNKLLRSNL